MDSRHDRIIDDIAEVCEMLNLGFTRSRGSAAGPDLRVTRGEATALIEVQRRWYAEPQVWQRWLYRYNQIHPKCFIVVSTHARQLRRKEARDYPQFHDSIYFVEEASWPGIVPALLIHHLASNDPEQTARE